jgi:hypothetical protein
MANLLMVGISVPDDAFHSPGFGGRVCMRIPHMSGFGKRGDAPELACRIEVEYDTPLPAAGGLS